MKILDVLEEMANTPCLENKVAEIADKNIFIKEAFEKNDVGNVRQLFGSHQFYANEVEVVRN